MASLHRALQDELQHVEDIVDGVGERDTGRPFLPRRVPVSRLLVR